MSHIQRSPFVFGKIVSGDTFTDRESEQKRLTGNIESKINSILISPRRWGKSSLVSRVVEKLRRTDPAFRFCFLDLFNVRSEQEFYGLLAREVLRIKESLVSKEVLDITPQRIEFIDPLFRVWFSTIYMKQ